MKTKTKKTDLMLGALIFITALALYIMKTISGFNNSDGIPHVAYTSAYPFILFAQHLITALLFIPYIIKSDDEHDMNLYILPLMLFAALGMMRTDANETITINEADHFPAIMFILFFISLTLMTFSSHALTGTVINIITAFIRPAFAFCFSPFIIAASFLLKCKTKTEKTVSIIINCIVLTASLIFSAIKSELTEFSFRKEYIPVFIFAAALFLFFSVKKEFSLMPIAFLPLFPFIAGVLFGLFPTPIFTLAASVAPTVVLLGTAAIHGENKKLKGYAQNIVHNPAAYIFVAVFILHTASAYFVNPGFFRNMYV